ncbi:unnamed protein product [Choristocarpus tenellus]
MFASIGSLSPPSPFASLCMTTTLVCSDGKEIPWFVGLDALGDRHCYSPICPEDRAVTLWLGETEVPEETNREMIYEQYRHQYLQAKEATRAVTVDRMVRDDLIVALGHKNEILTTHLGKTREDLGKTQKELGKTQEELESFEETLSELTRKVEKLEWALMKTKENEEKLETACSKDMDALESTTATAIRELNGRVTQAVLAREIAEEESDHWKQVSKEIGVESAKICNETIERLQCVGQAQGERALVELDSATNTNRNKALRTAGNEIYQPEVFFFTEILVIASLLLLLMVLTVRLKRFIAHEISTKAPLSPSP